MFDNTRDPLDALQRLYGTDPWQALDFLPRPVADAPVTSPDDDGASLADYVVAAECVQVLFDRLADGDVPPVEIDGPHRALLSRCHFDQTTTIPILLAADRLREGSIHTSLLVYRSYLAHKTHVGELDVSALEDLQRRGHVTSTASLLQWLTSPHVSTNRKLHTLQTLLDTTATALSWYLLDTAINHWPANLDGRPAVDLFRVVSNYATPVMGQPELIPLTAPATWTGLHRLAIQTASTYGALIRNELRAAKAPSGEDFVAVIDPTFALQVASAGLATPWFAAIKSSDDAGAFDEAVDTYNSVRTRALSPGVIARAGKQAFTDFLMPVKGDGVWPGSVVEVEYLLRTMLVNRPAGDALQTPQQILSAYDGKWFWLQTPSVLPVAVLDVAGSHQWHKTSPLLAWAMHASSNPFADQNVFSGFDKAIAYLTGSMESADRAHHLRELLLDIESVALPALLGAKILPLLFPGMSPEIASAMSAAIYPLIKLARKRLKGAAFI